ncbi:MAG TPA: hypothetical protein VGX25_27175 [Actinophytocola sp.]|uniref:hypothetical protein n=1 Tax=Actinophytocola sp. TaxID=1872138 RepID=UPI002DDDB392|nr:hypothetical protein [Actinophytocola sp.]HEV2783080.1 hypothetical protein [Actinophytocola sp.]
MGRDARATAGRLVTLARAGEWDAVRGSLSLLAYAGGGPQERLRHIVGELVEASASMVMWRAAGMGLSGTFSADLRRADESLIDIDGVDPPVRALIRAMLAAVNGCPEDAADQVALALAGGQQASVEVVVLALKWTVSALEWCADEARPEWLDRQAS